MIWSFVRSNLNFYRLHFLAFAIIPLLGATVLWASNGKFPIAFVDALYICISGATGTGLATADLSSLTAWQQAIIVILEIIGNQAAVAWVVVCIRRWYFLRNLKHIVAAELSRSNTNPPPHEASPSLRHIRETLARFKRERDEKSLAPWPHTRPKATRKANHHRDGIRPEMVRRLDIAPQPINPMGSRAPNLPSESEMVVSTSGIEILTRTASRRSVAPSHHPPPAEDDFGGFPSPPLIISRVLQRVSPRFQRKIERTFTVPRTETLVPSAGGAVVAPEGPVKSVPYLSFSATVRNSTFHGLTQENIEELGGVEYRALTALMWIIPLYYFGLVSICFVINAPYMALPKWDENFHPPLQHREINVVWYTAFQVIGAWANTGMSLVDQGMVPFQTAYPLVLCLVICVLAGNTCLPIFLRLMIWGLTKLPGRSRMKESLHFLLDHPRRCTIYLFPSRQTWLLFVIVMFLNCTNLLFDLVLNQGNPATESISFGVRFLDALLIAAACRNAGYQPIPMSSLYPAVQVLFVIMMYIAIYPIAMSVRGTNVYEAISLGVYPEAEEKDEINDDAHWNRPTESRVAIWGRYFMRHARRQLAFDMWWLALSLFLLCIIERKNLIDPEKQSWFNVFALIFELVSAYGTVGLSLGIPGRNYSLSGEFRTLSKLIVTLVMLRGRHRGLPVALDRAVLMPSEFLAERRPRSYSQSHSQPQLPYTHSHKGEHAMAEKEGRHDPECGDIPHPLRRGTDELEARMRTRTRTISLVVEERREADVKGTVVGMAPPWLADHAVAEASCSSSVEGSVGGVREHLA